MVTDPIADLLVRIKNAARRGQETVSMPASKLKGEILRVLKAEGFINTYEKSEDTGHATLRVQLRYINDGQPVITGMRRISRPGKRVYGRVLAKTVFVSREVGPCPGCSRHPFS